jgi:hypothetical protein
MTMKAEAGRRSLCGHEGIDPETLEVLVDLSPRGATGVLAKGLKSEAK